MRQRKDLSDATKRANEYAMKCSALANAAQVLLNVQYRRGDINFKILRCEPVIQNDVTVLRLDVIARGEDGELRFDHRQPIYVVNPPLLTRDGREDLVEVIQQMLEGFA